MPRRRHVRRAGSSLSIGERPSTSSEPSRVRTKIGVARPPRRRDVHSSTSTAVRRRPTASERRRKIRQDPLLESSDEESEEDSSVEDSSEEEAQPSTPMEAAREDPVSDQGAQPVSPSTAAAGEGPIPGGPTDLSVIPSVRTHVAIPIWHGEVHLHFVDV